MASASRALMRAYTRLNSTILRMRSLRGAAAADYVELSHAEDADGDDADEEAALIVPYSQNNPLVLLAQFFLLFARPIACTAFIGPFLTLMTFLADQYSMGVVFAVGAPALHVCFFFMVAMAALIKWLLLGRVTPGQYPLWGWYYCRWVAVHNMQRWIFRFLGIYRSTPLYRCAGVSVAVGARGGLGAAARVPPRGFLARRQRPPLRPPTPAPPPPPSAPCSFYFRLFGLRLGAHAVIDTAWITDCDLVEIGEGAYIARDVNIQVSGGPRVGRIY